MNVLSMRFYDVFADGKTEAGTAFVSASCSISAIEPFENARQMVFVDAYTIVTDFDENMSVVGFVNAGNDLSVLFAILG